MSRKRGPRMHQALTLLASKPRGEWSTLSFDGSCDMNGTRHATGRWGWLITEADGTVIRQQSGRVVAELVTNNVAEWVALRNGLLALDHTIPGVIIHGDSMLVIQTLRADWASKAPALTLLRRECWEILDELGKPWAADWIPRSKNHMADALTR